MRRFELNDRFLLLVALLSATCCFVVKDALSQQLNDGSSQTKLAQTTQGEQKPTPRREILRDKNGFEIGEIEIRSDGHQVLRDKTGSWVGEYDSTSNQTRDKNGFLVGTGNLLVGRIDQRSSTPRREILRDKSGFEIGEIEIRSDGRQILRDKNGFWFGEYDQKSNLTLDKNGFMMGTGNLLPMMLK